MGTGCSGLVGLASMDVLTQGMAHIIYVTGNEFGGTTGPNVGLPSNTAFSYAIVTLGSTGGPVTDSNGGKCYTTST